MLSAKDGNTGYRRQSTSCVSSAGSRLSPCETPSPWDRQLHVASWGRTAQLGSCGKQLISEKEIPHFRSYQESVEHGSLGGNYALISLPVINNLDGDKYSMWAPKSQGWHLSLGLFSSVKGQGLLIKAGAALIPPQN